MDRPVTDHVWTLRATEGELRKRHTWALGQWSTQSYDRAWLYSPRVRPVDDLRALYTLLDELRARPDTCIVRGSLDDELLDEQGQYTGAPITRRQHERSVDVPHAERAWWRPADRHWVMLDLDALPSGVSPAQARAMLPPPWRYAACVWHYSGSHGVSEGTRLHLVFWLKHAACDASLREYWRGNDHVDTALYSPVQIHYTADPSFAGAPDPVSVRIGYLEGGEVDEPKLIDLATWQARIDTADAERRARAEASRAALSRLPAIDPDRVTAAQAEARLESACDQILAAAPGNRHATINRSAYVAGLFGAPWSSASVALLGAAQQVLPADRWDDAERTIADGYSAGARAHSRARPVADVRPDLRAPDSTSLDDARDQIGRAVRDALVSHGRIVLATGTGTGKSTAIAREIGRALGDDEIGAVTICVPTRALAAQWAEALPGAVIRPTRDEETDTSEGRYRCERLAEYRAAEYLEEGGGRSLCAACWLHSPASCPYIAVSQRRERGDVLITTHAYGARTQDWRDVVVIDESPHEQVLGSVYLSAGHVSAALAAGDITADSSSELELYAQTGYLGEIGSVTYHGALGARALGLLTDEVCDPDAAALQPGWEALTALATASSNAWLGVTWSSGGLSVPLTRPLDIPAASTLIVADATATPGLSQYLYGDVETLALSVPRQARVIQYTRSLSRRSIKADCSGWSSVRAQQAWSEFHALVRRHCRTPLWVLLLAQLSIPDVQRDLAEDIAAGRVIWYRSTLARGANTWPDIDGVALADYHPRRPVVRATAEQLCIDGVAMVDREVDAELAAWLPEIAWQLRDAELLQAAGRLRGPGTILIASPTILEALPPDQIVDAAATSAERIRFEVGRHGVWRLQRGERAPDDLILWTVQAHGRRERWVSGYLHTAESVHHALVSRWGYPVNTVLT